MNYIDLFSGIGGFALGAYWAGMQFENHFFSDIEKYAVDLYQKRFPNAIPLGDITKIDTVGVKETYGNDWVLTGGFPCQDISIAGKGAGIEGKRSGLWFEYWRLIRDLRPRVAIMENVGALTFRGLDTVLGSLSEIGYNAEWQDIRAEDVGAPHKRERIWIIAYPNGIGKSSMFFNERERPRELVPDTSGIRRSTREYIEQQNKDCLHENRQHEENIKQRDKRQRGVEQIRKIEVSDTDSFGWQGQRAECHDEGQVGLCSGEAWRCPQDWSAEPPVGRLVDGLSGRVDRLRGLGNAIVPQIAMILWTLVKPLLENSNFEEVKEEKYVEM